jgi:hypothetical protein
MRHMITGDGKMQMADSTTYLPREREGQVLYMAKTFYGPTGPHEETRRCMLRFT